MYVLHFVQLFTLMAAGRNDLCAFLNRGCSNLALTGCRKTCRLTLDVQHGDECREDLCFGPLHHVLVRLQDTLQDEGEGRQDVRGRRHHAGSAQRETSVRGGGQARRKSSRQGW